jgi:DNA-binding NarL/FixJ family response regulator
MNEESATLQPYRVLIADGHAVVRRGVRVLLESQSGIQVCGEATNGGEAIECVKEVKPDLVVFDPTMSEVSGLEATRVIREVSPSTAVLIFSVRYSEEFAREMLRCGASGYVSKSDLDTELLTAVRHVQQHKPFFKSRITMALRGRVQSKASSSAAAPEGSLPSWPLTAREIEVLRTLANGLSNREAAAALGVSTRTIESHRNHIMRKMKFSSFSELIRFAVRNDLVER